jgi:hypothetical protein
MEVSNYTALFMNTCCVAIKALKRRWSIAANVKVAAYSLSIYSLALLHMQDANTSVSIWNCDFIPY